jgi:hypothetical protein
MRMPTLNVRELQYCELVLTVIPLKQQAIGGVRALKILACIPKLDAMCLGSG